MLPLSCLTLLANPGHGNGPTVGLLLAAEASGAAHAIMKYLRNGLPG